MMISPAFMCSPPSCYRLIGILCAQWFLEPGPAFGLISLYSIVLNAQRILIGNIAQAIDKGKDGITKRFQSISQADSGGHCSFSLLLT
jgi:hypothetical protein